MILSIIKFIVIFTVDETGNLNAAHILFNNREGKDTFSERSTTCERGGGSN